VHTSLEVNAYLVKANSLPPCRDGPAADKAPSLSGAKAFFLDRRFIMQMTRNGAVSVVWPRSSATAAAKRRPPAL